MPRALRIGIWTAWICFGLGLVQILINPWAPLLGIPWAFAAWGLSRGKAWSGYGPALWQGSLLAWVCYRLATGWEAFSGPVLDAAFGLLWAALIAILLFRSGRAAEASSNSRLGNPWTWLVLTCCTLAFFVMLLEGFEERGVMLLLELEFLFLVLERQLLVGQQTAKIFGV